MAKLLYQGHGSCRIVTDAGFVVYLDPFAGEGYDLPANLIFVTHQHHDHNEVDKMPHASGCVIITEKEALIGGRYNDFVVSGVRAKAVEAYNQNHRRESSVGYILTIDGKSFYFAGDTSTTEQMQAMAALKLDWAMLPIDGIYNMGPEEAARCAALIGAKKVIPIHMKPGGLFDPEMAEKFNAPNRLILRPGEEIQL
ncbi:MAG: MBL fold metallo-hydrolase [Oscillospiraceae bacterium]|nr:MBL fold metallo-hydrolase [Oscillospiraceae bacterium]